MDTFGIEPLGGQALPGLGQPNGLATLDSNGRLPLVQLPPTAVLSSQAGQPNGLATLDGSSRLHANQLPQNVLVAQAINVPNGIAGLDQTGKVPTGNLPAGLQLRTWVGEVLTLGAGQVHDWELLDDLCGCAHHLTVEQLEAWYRTLSLLRFDGFGLTDYAAIAWGAPEGDGLLEDGPFGPSSAWRLTGRRLQANATLANLVRGTCTLEGWFKIYGLAGGSNAIVWASSGPGSTHKFALYAESTGAGLFRLGYHANPNAVTATGANLPTDTWHHFMLLRSSSSVKLAVNGQLYLSATDNNPYSSGAITYPLTWGCAGGYDGWAAPDIALAHTRLSQILRAPLVGPYPVPDAPFPENDAEIAERYRSSPLIVGPPGAAGVQLTATIVTDLTTLVTLTNVTGAPITLRGTVWGG